MTPQAQLMYVKASIEDFAGSNNVNASLPDSKSVRARFGASLNKRFNATGTKGYVVASVIREFEDETQVDVSGFTLTNAVDKWTGEFGLGLTHGWHKGTMAYEFTSSIIASTSLHAIGDSNAAQGNVGLKVSF